MSSPVATYPKSVQPGIPKLGQTPVGWQKLHFGDLFEEVSRPVSMEDDEVYQLVTVKRSRGGIEARSKLPGSKISVKSQFYLKSGDFLISKRQIVHGACAIVPDDFNDAIVSNEYSILRPTKHIRTDYLRYLVHSIYVQRTFFHSSVGVHVEKMIFKLEDWFKWPINIPSLAYQSKVSSCFLEIDKKIALLKEKKLGLEDYKRGLMQKLFSQKLRFTRPDGSAYPDWEIRKFGAIGRIYGGLTGKSAGDFGRGKLFVTYKQVFKSSVVDVSECGSVHVSNSENQNNVMWGGFTDNGIIRNSGRGRICFCIS